MDHVIWTTSKQKHFGTFRCALTRACERCDHGEQAARRAHLRVLEVVQARPLHLSVGLVRVRHKHKLRPHGSPVKPCPHLTDSQYVRREGETCDCDNNILLPCLVTRNKHEGRDRTPLAPSGAPGRWARRARRTKRCFQRRCAQVRKRIAQHGSTTGHRVSVVSSQTSDKGRRTPIKFDEPMRMHAAWHCGSPAASSPPGSGWAPGRWTCARRCVPCPHQHCTWTRGGGGGGSSGQNKPFSSMGLMMNVVCLARWRGGPVGIGGGERPTCHGPCAPHRA